jgi:hypothetical protein
MPFTYTNRKDQKYYLHQGTTKAGGVRYYFSREEGEGVLESIPQGYRISESLTGLVSLVKDQAELILAEELASVEAALKRHPEWRDYRAEVKKDQVVIYKQSGPDVGSLSGIMAKYTQTPLQDMKKRVKEQLDKTASFTPVLRFVLVDPKPRTFQAERRVVVGGGEGWVEISEPGRLDILARRLVPRLGK